MAKPKGCKFLVLGAKRYAPLGSPQRHLPTVRKACGEPSVALLVQDAYEDRGMHIERKEMPMCAAHADRWLALGVSRWHKEATQ